MNLKIINDLFILINNIQVLVILCLRHHSVFSRVFHDHIVYSKLTNISTLVIFILIFFILGYRIHQNTLRI